MSTQENSDKTSSKNQNCPKCGSELVVDTVAGLCSGCLLASAMAQPKSHGPTKDSGLKLDQLTNYEILEELGQGGSATVYKAKNLELQRIEALKVINEQWLAEPSFVERFKREARTMAALSHPNILPIYGLKHSEDSLFLSLEYIDGANFREIMAREELTADDFVSYLQQVIEALDFAHQRGILHRDLKPENILIDQNDQVKLADFGLARLIDDSASQSPNLTATGEAFGTPHYMAPEQMNGRSTATKKSDYYALAVLCYEVVTGVIPRGRFEEPSSAAKPGFKSLARKIEDFVMQSLQMNPEKRPDSLESLKNALHSPKKKQIKSLKPKKSSQLPQKWRKYLSNALIFTGALQAYLCFSPFGTVRLLRGSRAPVHCWKATVNILGLENPLWIIPLAGLIWATVEYLNRRGWTSIEKPVELYGSITSLIIISFLVSYSSFDPSTATWVVFGCSITTQIIGSIRAYDQWLSNRILKPQPSKRRRA